MIDRLDPSEFLRLKFLEQQIWERIERLLEPLEPKCVVGSNCNVMFENQRKDVGACGLRITLHNDENLDSIQRKLDIVAYHFAKYLIDQMMKCVQVSIVVSMNESSFHNIVDIRENIKVLVGPNLFRELLESWLQPYSPQFKLFQKVAPFIIEENGMLVKNQPNPFSLIFRRPENDGSNTGIQVVVDRESRPSIVTIKMEVAAFTSRHACTFVRIVS